MKVDMSTGEILDDNDGRLIIGRGGLYTALPIPAYKVLVHAKKHAAKNVLVCLVSFLGYGRNDCWPSYETLIKETGHGRKTVSQALKDLTEFGFIRTYHWRQGKKNRVKYYVQDACYSSSKMNKTAKAYLPFVRTCQQCGKGMSIGDFKLEKEFIAHWGCSGSAVRIGPKKKSHLVRRSPIEATSTGEVANG